MPSNARQLKNSTRCRFNNWADKLVSCPFCSERLTLEEYRSDHSKSVHRLDEDEICIFCRDFVFRDPRCYDEIAHRDACSKSFVERQKGEKRNVEEEPVKKQAVYSRRNYFKNRVMRCPHCHEEVTFAEYENHHARDVHRLSCIYCDDEGAHDTTRCFHEFVDRNLMPPPMTSAISDDPPEETPPDDPPPPMPSAIRDDPPVLCHCISYDREHRRRRMDGRRYEPRFANFYEDYPRYSPELGDAGTLPVFSDESGLGEEVSALFRMFFSGEWKFYHIYVRRYGYAKFLQEMPESLVVSRFWCLCDCGMNSAKLHRHMIIATRNARQLTNAWKRVRVPRHRVVKYKKKIEKPIHLAYTIHYVSSKKQKCKGWGRNRRNVRINAHFYINRPLHTHTVMAMCTLWSGGLTEWLKRRNGGKSVLGWDIETFRDRHRHLKYRARIVDAMSVTQHCPVPLRWEPLLSDVPSLEPDPEGRFLLHWFEGEEMRVGETEDADPDYLDFMKRQAELGNSAKTRMWDKWYTLNKTQAAQASIIEIMKIRQEDALLAKDAELRNREDALRAKDVELQIGAEKIRDLQHELNNFRQETRNLWQTLGEVKCENAELRRRALRDADVIAELGQRHQITIHNMRGDFNN